MTEPALIAVDWGTSSFRLWVLDHDAHVISESRGGDGLLFAAREGFSNILLRHLTAAKAPSDRPILICGMAGARNGWVEAGYVETPAELVAISRGAIPVPGVKRDIRILPGLCQRLAGRPDVMRGEETQLLGAASALSERSLVCMPGTHSKWVTVDEGRVESFSTYMTGELYDAISKHTILAAPEKTVAEGADSPSFKDAVRAAFAHPGRITSQLFAARSGQLLNGATPAAALAHISGTLIGAEIGGATGSDNRHKIRLVASGGMRTLYESALKTVEIAFESIDADDAVRKGLSIAARQIWS
jgi:2-dehydro-3-deoxygalactonokinase